MVACLIIMALELSSGKWIAFPLSPYTVTRNMSTYDYVVKQRHANAARERLETAAQSASSKSVSVQVKAALSHKGPIHNKPVTDQFTPLKPLRFTPDIKYMCNLSLKFEQRI